jgi:hypothetical protein
LHRVSQSCDLIQIVAIITKYTSSFGVFTKILHLEGEEVFGSIKRKANLPLGSEANSHQHDQMNFSHPKMANATTLIN